MIDIPQNIKKILEFELPRLFSDEVLDYKDREHSITRYEWMKFKTFLKEKNNFIYDPQEQEDIVRIFFLDKLSILVITDENDQKVKFVTYIEKAVS